MSQDLFTFQNLLIGLLRLSSSNQGDDPEVIARFIHQITGIEFCYVPAGESDSITNSKKTEGMGMCPESFTPPRLVEEPEYSYSEADCGAKFQQYCPRGNESS